MPGLVPGIHALKQIQALLKPYSATQMACFKIDPKIGNVNYDELGLEDPI